MGRNRNSRIVTTRNSGRVKTRTIYRDADSMRVSVLTENGETSLRIQYPCLVNRYSNVYFNGREARTLYRILKKHYEAFGSE